MRLYLYIDAPIVVGREEGFGLGGLRRLLLQKVGGDAQHLGELKTADFQFFAGWGGVDCELMSNIVFDTFMFVIWILPLKGEIEGVFYVCAAKVQLFIEICKWRLNVNVTNVRNVTCYA